MTFGEWVRVYQIPPQAVAAFYGMVLPVSNVTATSEAATQNLIRIEASKYGFTMWRNNNGAVTTDDGRHIRFGVGNDSKKLNEIWKSPDLIGIGPNGRFVGCEVKRPDWRAPENNRDRAQLNCLNQINALGGIGFFATSEEDYEKRMNENA